MTFQPPPPAPGEQPQGWQPPAPPPSGAPVPPPATGWQAPATPAAGPMQSFDAKSVNPQDWAIMACGFLAFIFSFFSYYTATVKFAGFSASAHENAWHGFFGWFAMLSALVGAGALAASIFAPQQRLPLPARLITLGGFALATLCVLLAWFITPGVGGPTTGVDYGRGIGFYLSLIVIVAGLVLSFLRLKATGGKLPWEAGGNPLQ